MTENSDELTTSRRNFMRNLAISALAATTAGTGAALISGEWKKTTFSPSAIRELPAVPSAVPAVRSAQNVVTAQSNASELLGRLVESQAENMRLQAVLEATKRDLESLVVSNGSSRSATEDLSIQLTGANEQIGILSGLVALYDQLDEVDVTETVQNGLAIVADSINDLIDQTPVLSEGIELGHQALAEVEAHLPQLEDGRIWMEAQTKKLGAFYDTVELVLQGVLNSVGSFLDLAESWFDGVRKWLPFGIDEKAAKVVNALSELVAETPHTISGLDTYIAKPLDVWLAREEDVPRLQRTLIKPIREQVLAQANETINLAESVKTTYQDQLALPMETAAANRNTVRQQISNYRQRHQV